MKCESYTNSIVPRIYDHLKRGTLGDCIISAEGKFIRAHKLILSISSEYFEVRLKAYLRIAANYSVLQAMFNVSTMERPIVIVSGIKFIDLCLILDFAYLGQAQVPHDRLDEFLRAGELLQIKGIKEGRIHFMTNLVHSVHQTTTTTVNRSFDSTISSTQETYSEPLAKRPREDDDITIQEASEIMKMLLESNPDMDIESAQVKTMTTTTTIPNPIHNNACISRAPTAMPQTRNMVNPKQMPLPFSIKDKPKFLCRFCGRSLSTQGRINKHEKECNDNPDREVTKCDICQVELKPSSLAQHKNTKHGLKGKQLSPKLMIMNANIAATIKQLPIVSASPSCQLTAVDQSADTSQTQRQSSDGASEAPQASHHHELRSAIIESSSFDSQDDKEDDPELGTTQM